MLQEINSMLTRGKHTHSEWSDLPNEIEGLISLSRNVISSQHAMAKITNVAFFC